MNHERKTNYWKLVHALYVATERAVSNGDRLLELGKQDFNRG